MTDGLNTQDKVLFALRHPRGRYTNARTSQLSGIPGSTLYEWGRHGVYAPDFGAESPKAWSYRDLVYLRLLAWLRQGGMERYIAAEQVSTLKKQVAEGRSVRRIYADRSTLIVDDEDSNRVGGVNILPFDDLSKLLRVFDIAEPVKELRGKVGRLWAPDLVEPSLFTSITPWVMAGDPCVTNTRIPTSSIHALRAERGLNDAEIVELYPGLSIEAVKDADLLERRLRGIDLPTSAAA